MSLKIKSPIGNLNYKEKMVLRDFVLIQKKEKELLDCVLQYGKRNSLGQLEVLKYSEVPGITKLARLYLSLRLKYIYQKEIYNGGHKLKNKLKEVSNTSALLFREYFEFELNQNIEENIKKIILG